MTDPTRALPYHPSAEEQDRIERFESAYNAIDRLLRKELGKDNLASFASMIKEYSQRGRLGKADQENLRAFADLRNVLIHEKVKPRYHLAAPTSYVVGQIEELKRRLLSPELVLPRFQKKVETMTMSDSLTSVLRVISERDYSQFPVYDDQGFKGLLTENGITRWLAHHVTNKLSLIELDEVPVKTVLREEENKKNFTFISRSTTVDIISELFATRDLLEAALITNSGNPHEKLMGIVTRWDVVQLNVKCT
jgi:predicted transcriptional regulator